MCYTYKIKITNNAIKLKVFRIIDTNQLKLNLMNISGSASKWTLGNNNQSSQNEVEINNEPTKAIPSTNELIKKGAEFQAMLNDYYENKYKHTKVYSGITNVAVIIAELEEINS